MPRPKVKECKAITIRMDATIYDQLDEFCKEAGQAKTVAIERALTMYIDNYKRQQKILAEAEKNR